MSRPAWTPDERADWLLEPMLEHAGLAIGERWYAESRTYARCVCTRP